MEAPASLTTTPIWAWVALASAVLVACVALAAAFQIARSASALGAARHEERCTSRHDSVTDDFRKLRREYAALADDATADLETAQLERARAQAARARAAKSEKATTDSAPATVGPESHAQFRQRMRSQRYGGA